MVREAHLAGPRRRRRRRRARPRSPCGAARGTGARATSPRRRREQPGDAVDRRDLERLLASTAAAGAPGRRRASIVLPAPGGPIIEKVVPPRRRDLERAPRAAPARARRRGRRARRAADARRSATARRELDLAAERVDELGERADRAHVDRPRPSAASPVVRARDDRAPHPARARAEELREDAAHRLHRSRRARARRGRARPRAPRAGRTPSAPSVAAAMARSNPLPVFLTSAGARLTTIAVLAEVDADLRERALHAHAALADGRLGEADELEGGDAALSLDLDADGVSVEADERGAERGGEHARRDCEARAGALSASFSRRRGVRYRHGQLRGWHAPPRGRRTRRHATCASRSSKRQFVKRAGSRNTRSIAAVVAL